MIKVYLVEDQQLIRNSLKVVLESLADIKVIGMAENGEQAVQLCHAERPDIILMDIQMPLMDGVKATEIIKAHWPEVKVIILTTFQDVNYVKKALNAGAEGYILKAVNPQFLIKGIELVYYGGSLVPHELARSIYQNLDNTETEDISDPGKSIASNEYNLNQQELKVLTCLAQGMQNKDIAEKLFLSLGTVKNYISGIYSKLEVKNRAAAILKAIEESIISVK